jgi:hypothetical protein
MEAPRKRRRFSREFDLEAVRPAQGAAYSEEH